MTETSLLIVPTERHRDVELARREASPKTLARHPHGQQPAAEGELAHPALDVQSRWGFLSTTFALLVPGMSLASPYVTRLATRMALEALPPDRLRQPKEAAAKVALAHVIDRSLGRLRSAGTEPRHLRALGISYTSALAELLETVDAILAGAHLVDARGLGFLVADALHSATQPHGRFTVPTAITVRGIVTWEAADLAWLEALHQSSRASGGRGVTVELPSFPQGDSDVIDAVADALERRWASLLDPPEIAWIAADPATPMTAISAATAEGEARAVAAEVLAAMSRGSAPERIAIVVPTLDDATLEPLRAALSDASICFDEPRGRSVANTPDGRAALSLLRMSLGPMTRQQAIDLLRAPGLHSGPWTDRASTHEAAKRATSLAHRLRDVPVEVDRTGRLLIDGLTQLIETRRADRGSSGPHPPDLALARGPHPPDPSIPRGRGGDDESWMPRALERLVASARWLGEGETRADLVRRFLTLLDKLRLGAPSIEELGQALRTEQKGEGPRTVDIMGQGIRAAQVVRELAEGMVQAADDLNAATAPCSAAELCAELERMASEQGCRSRGVAPRAGAVPIGLAEDLSGLQYDVVVITGLDARAYNGSAGADDSLLGDALRSRLPSPCRPPSARERVAWQRAALAWTIAGAQSVATSFTRGDDSEPNDPHPLFSWAVAKGARSHTEPASRVSEGASRLRLREVELLQTALGAPPSPDIAERARIERARTAFFLDPRLGVEDYTGKIVLADDWLRAQLRTAVGGGAADRPIAVTHIERAAGCAFAGFARRVLRVRRVEDLMESADARERGALVHRALQASFQALREMGAFTTPRPDDPQALSQKLVTELSIAKSAAAHALGLATAVTPLRRETLTKAIADVLQVVLRVLEGEDTLQFFDAERRFGPNEPEPWKALELFPLGDSGPALYVDGQIDRIDRSDDGRIVRVIDYKTGRLPDGEEQRRALQLPIYAQAAARALDPQELRALYVSVRQRGLIEESPRREEDQRDLAAQWLDASRLAGQVVFGLWDGNVGPRPARATLCERCDARDVCRRPAVVPVEEVT